MATSLTQKAEAYEILYEKTQQARLDFRSQFGYDPARTTQESSVIEKAKAAEWQKMQDELIKLCKSAVEF